MATQSIITPCLPKRQQLRAGTIAIVQPQLCSTASIQANRRRGRPAWTRNPDDTPLRDGNRDRLIGLLTERCERCFCVCIAHISYWYTTPTTSGLQKPCYTTFLRQTCTCFTGFKHSSKPIPSHGCVVVNSRVGVAAYSRVCCCEYSCGCCCEQSWVLLQTPFPQNGDWDDVSGETFLRKLLAMSPDQAKFDMVRAPTAHACITSASSIECVCVCVCVHIALNATGAGPAVRLHWIHYRRPPTAGSAGHGGGLMRHAHMSIRTRQLLLKCCMTHIYNVLMFCLPKYCYLPRCFPDVMHGL